MTSRGSAGLERPPEPTDEPASEPPAENAPPASAEPSPTAIPPLDAVAEPSVRGRPASGPVGQRRRDHWDPPAGVSRGPLPEGVRHHRGTVAAARGRRGAATGRAPPRGYRVQIRRLEDDAQRLKSFARASLSCGSTLPTISPTTSSRPSSASCRNNWANASTCLPPPSRRPGNRRTPPPTGCGRNQPRFLARAVSNLQSRPLCANQNQPGAGRDYSEARGHPGRTPSFEAVRRAMTTACHGSGEGRGAGAKSESRIPKSEGNPRLESRNPKARRYLRGTWALRISAFGLPSVFGIRVSDFRRLLCLTSLLVALCPVNSHAAAAAAFDSANRLYEEGKFANAASAYEKLAQSGETSAALYFNLGNALFKSGQIGRAIAAYRTGEQITPRDPDLRANLQFARNQVQSPTLSPSRWQRWLGRLTLNEWTLLAAGAVGSAAPLDCAAMAASAQARPASVRLLASHTRRIAVRLRCCHLARNPLYPHGHCHCPRGGSSLWPAGRITHSLHGA